MRAASDKERTLGPLAAHGADPRHIADAAVLVWGAIHSALSPVIGPRGTAALYKRALNLSRVNYPWLAGAHEETTLPGDFSALCVTLSQQPGHAAASAHDAMLRTFHDLLANLIGRSLTQRLLQAVWELPSIARPGHDS